MATYSFRSISQCSKHEALHNNNINVSIAVAHCVCVLSCKAAGGKLVFAWLADDKSLNISNLF